MPLFGRKSTALRGGEQPRLIRFASPSPTAAKEVANLQSFSEPDFQAWLTDVYNRVSNAWRVTRLTDLEADVTIDLLAAWTARPPTAALPMQVAAEALRGRIEEGEAGRAYEHLTVSLAWTVAPGRARLNSSTGRSSGAAGPRSVVAPAPTAQHR